MAARSRYWLILLGAVFLSVIALLSWMGEMGANLLLQPPDWIALLSTHSLLPFLYGLLVPLSLPLLYSYSLRRDISAAPVLLILPFLDIGSAIWLYWGTYGSINMLGAVLFHLVASGTLALAFWSAVRESREERRWLAWIAQGANASERPKFEPSILSGLISPAPQPPLTYQSRIDNPARSLPKLAVRLRSRAVNASLTWCAWLTAFCTVALLVQVYFMSLTTMRVPEPSSSSPPFDSIWLTDMSLRYFCFLPCLAAAGFWLALLARPRKEWLQSLAALLTRLCRWPLDAEFIALKQSSLDEEYEDMCVEAKERLEATGEETKPYPRVDAVRDWLEYLPAALPARLEVLLRDEQMINLLLGVYEPGARPSGCLIWASAALLSFAMMFLPLGQQGFWLAGTIWGVVISIGLLVCLALAPEVLQSTRLRLELAQLLEADGPWTHSDTP